MRNARQPRRRRPRAKGPWRLVNRLAHALRANGRQRARRNIAHHYDLGNDFYAAWLDAGMTYSSAIFADRPGEPLEAAQEHKVRPLLDRLELKPGQHLLEIGCGWGALAEIAARDYGVHVTGLTLSAEQKAYADGAPRRAPASPTGSRSSSPTIATSPARSTRSPASRWSRRSARNIGRPISDASPAR